MKMVIEDDITLLDRYQTIKPVAVRPVAATGRGSDG